MADIGTGYSILLSWSWKQPLNFLTQYSGPEKKEKPQVSIHTVVDGLDKGCPKTIQP